MNAPNIGFSEELYTDVIAEVFTDDVVGGLSSDADFNEPC